MALRLLYRREEGITFLKMKVKVKEKGYSFANGKPMAVPWWILG
jgi:hypothetical protein